ncbi:MAG: asparagine synthase-related protein [Candidatus Eisenbacteria bacterium]
MKKHVTAICLLSGGLDSSLAVRMMQEQDIEVTVVNFTGPFGACAGDAENSPAQSVARALGVALKVVPLKDDYLEIIRNPRHGYGSNVNPCIDCRIYMLKKAREIMEAESASFVVTGEVVGQRPMSQRAVTMRQVEKASGLDGFLLRPLCAQLMPPTVPEEKGWVDRDRLLGISGRSRKELMRLAGEKGVTGYSSPGGGCLLTDPNFSLRMRDLLAHDTLTFDAIELLKVGRHFRLPRGTKLVVGRNESDNERLLALSRDSDTVIITESCPGPTAILRGASAPEEESLAASIVARYSDGKAEGGATVSIKSSTGEHLLYAGALAPDDVGNLII